MQGHINRNDLANLTMWLIFLVMVAGIVLTQADGNVAVLLIGLPSSAVSALPPRTCGTMLPATSAGRWTTWRPPS